MIDHADTTDLLDQTTQTLTGESGTPTPQEGIALIDQWIAPLEAGENTKPIAEELQKLKTLLKAEPVDSGAVFAILGEIAIQLTAIAPDMGSEGEMPSLLEGLASALRLTAGTSKADQ